MEGMIPKNHAILLRFVYMEIIRDLLCGSRSLKFCAITN